MPLQKPSPHRFIAPTAPSTQTPKPKPKSNLRHAIGAHTPKPGQELPFKNITPAKRFVVAPTQRQHAVNTPRAPDRVEEPHSSASTEYTPRPKAARKFERVESIEDASQSSPSRAADGDASSILRTIERDAVSAEDDEEDTDDELLFATFSPKRRRTSPPVHAAPPDTPSSTAPHRFRVPPTPLPDPPTTSTTPAARPHFILPSPAPLAPARPPPEIFSPSRRTHKYLPAGLASCVQSWIIEAAAPGSVGSVWGRERDDGVRVRVRIARLGDAGGRAGPGEGDREEVECCAGGVVFARGETEEGMHSAEGARVLLAGQGGVRGAGGVKVRVGSVVGIRAPTWDVDVGGEKWTVGVDWLVL